MTQLLDSRSDSTTLSSIAEPLVMNVANSSEGTPSHDSTSPVPSLSTAAIKNLAQVFKLLADETRLKILALLTEKDEFHVRALCELLGQSQPAVSHHLALLRVAGLIDCRREGKHNFYRVLPERVQQFLDTVFAGVPESGRRVRFENYVLMFSPPIRQ